MTQGQRQTQLIRYKSGCRRSFYHESLFSFFVFACSYSTLLPGAERLGALYGQQAQTGSG